MEHIRVMVVDDHRLARQGLCSVLSEYTDIELVGEAGDGQEAVELVNRYQPAVVVMDINMPKMNGIDATREIRRQHPKTAVIGVSANAEEESQTKMIQAGACAVMAKEKAGEQLYEDIVRAFAFYA